MLISELRGWQWLITWDNPIPANSSAMLAALGNLGRVTQVQTKTTVLLAPKAKVSWQAIRAAISAHLHPAKGNAAYVNLRSGKAFQRGADTYHHWRQIV